MCTVPSRDALYTTSDGAMQVMYDASGVRLHAGKQATALNIIISQLPADHPGSETIPLRDRLGHTPRQVRSQIVPD